MRELLARQENVVALWQLTAQERRRALRALARGDWARLTSRCVLAATHRPLPTQQVWAALLHAGKHARLSGRSALVLHGWQNALDAPHDVVVPHAARPPASPPWLRIHRSRQTVTGPAATPARTSPHLATAHAAAWARTDREAMFIVISVLQQRLTTPHRLAAALDKLPTLPRRALVIEVLNEFRAGAQSLNELDFGGMCRRYGVPQPVRQTAVTDARGSTRLIDVEFRTASGRRLRLEIEGLHHLEPDAYMADVDRHNHLAVVDAATSLRVTTWHLRHEARGFMTFLRGVIESR